MQEISSNLIQMRRLAKSLTTPADYRTGAAGGGFDSLLKAALQQPDKSLVYQVADLVLLNSSSRLGSVESPSQATPQFSSSRPWRSGIPLSADLAGFKPLDQAKANLAALQLPASSANQPAKTASSTSARGQEFDALIQQAAGRHGVDPNLVRAVVTAESDFDPQTVSHAGAMGLMQLMPETAKDLGVGDPFDPVQNIEGGTRYLAMMLERFGGDETMALAAYNWGPGNLERSTGQLPAETRTYLKRVARYKSQYAKGLDARA